MDQATPCRYTQSLVTPGGPERDDQCRIHRECTDDGRRLDQGAAEQRLPTLRRAHELKGHTPPVGPEKRTGPAGAGIGPGVGPGIRLGALLYCSVDAGKALQGDRTLTRDVDSIVDQTTIARVNEA